MPKRWGLWAVAVYLGVCGSAHAQDENARARRALSNTHQEIARCVVFFHIGADCIGSQNPDLSRQLEGNSSRLFELATNMGQQMGMSLDATVSRVRGEAEEMQNLMQHSCSNVSSITNRYANRCGIIARNADKIFLEYYNKP